MPCILPPIRLSWRKFLVCDSKATNNKQNIWNQNWSIFNVVSDWKKKQIWLVVVVQQIILLCSVLYLYSTQSSLRRATMKLDDDVSECVCMTRIAEHVCGGNNGERSGGYFACAIRSNWRHLLVNMDNKRWYCYFNRHQPVFHYEIQ